MIAALGGGTKHDKAVRLIMSVTDEAEGALCEGGEDDADEL